MERYVIAVHRHRRREVGPDWSRPLAELQGVRVVGDANPYRLRIEATPPAIAKAHDLFDAFCHIEPLKQRVPLMGSVNR